MGQDGSMAWWEPSLLSALAQHYRVTIFDFPGVGYSDPPLSNVTLDWLADETAGLIQALSLVHPTVLGWGLGGEVALALAERHPASQGSLVLVDSSAGGPDATRPTVSVSAALDSDSATADSLASTFFAASSAADGSASGPSESASILPVAPVTAWLAAVDSSVPDNLTEAALADERTVQLGVWSSDALVLGSAAVAVPTLVVFGSDDVVFPTHDDVLLRRSIAASQLVILRNAGYASMFQDSSQFVSSLERFTG
jgi:pimeloyl-ACP methyl ester carboxylesterase